MIQEDYVSYETAKLLKEKGFNESTDKQYNLDKIVGDYNITDRSRHPERYLDVPTLQMAMKWLREVHNIEIRVIYDNDKLCWYGACNPMSESQILLGFGRKNKSYEEACEEAIKYCLENLI